MVDLITIEKKLLHQQNSKLILQPTEEKKINGKVYGFVMAWQNVISKNTDQTRASKIAMFRIPKTFFEVECRLTIACSLAGNR